MGVHPDEDIGEVLLGIDAVRLAGRDDGVQAGEVFTRLIVAAGLPMLPINTLAIDSDNGILYAGTNGAGIYVSYDGALS